MKTEIKNGDAGRSPRKPRNRKFILREIAGILHTIRRAVTSWTTFVRTSFHEFDFEYAKTCAQFALFSWLRPLFSSQDSAHFINARSARENQCFRRFSLLFANRALHKCCPARHGASNGMQYACNFSQMNFLFRGFRGGRPASPSFFPIFTSLSDTTFHSAHF